MVWQMLISANILQYSFIFSVKISFPKILEHLFGIILCRPCYLAMEFFTKLMNVEVCEVLTKPKLH
jgi:hypothetical protein